MVTKCLHSHTRTKYGWDQSKTVLRWKIEFCVHCGEVLKGSTDGMNEKELETYKVSKLRENLGYGEFEPYELKNGPIQKNLGHLAEEDPNYIVAKDGSGCDSVYIESKRAERKYFDMLGVRHPERGEKIMGIKAELKDPPKKRIYSFSKKSVSSR